MTEDLLIEQRETNRLLGEIARDLRELLGKPAIGVRWHSASNVLQDGGHSIVQPGETIVMDKPKC